jgi:glycosyltransferase involved in cell wall biosynthesis
MFKKKIYFYCPILENGGIKTTTEIYINYLQNFFEIELFTNAKKISYLKNFKSKKNIKIFNLNNTFLANKIFLNSIFVFFKIIKRNKNEIVGKKQIVIFSMQNHIIILLLNFFFLKKKILIRTSSIIPNKNNLKETQYYQFIWLKKIVIYFYRLADHIITFSNDNVIKLKKIGVQNVSCVYNYFKKNAINRAKIKKDHLNIFFIGRFSYEKDPEFFLRNLLDLKKIKIHLIGDGGLKNKLLNISKNAENVYFYSYTENPFLKFKNKIDLLCITSKYEGTPNVMGEAMSYKIPILAPKEVGLAKKILKNGKLGYLYKSGDEHSFKGEIKKICNNYASATLKAKYAWKSMDRFNKKNTLFKIKKILDNL